MFFCRTYQQAVATSQNPKNSRPLSEKQEVGVAERTTIAHRGFMYTQIFLDSVSFRSILFQAKKK
jgi:hypothetical protein